MAKSVAVWGIDIGRCALKALRCRLDGDAVVADGFDYIEYPKLLSQPEADAPQLVKEALEQFLTRNSVKNDKVAISVSGESGLARYFKPPPVDVKKISDIVKYEAKQQIPFALEDVVWDYQRMAGGQEVDGFALDAEIGLFAMKREQVAKAMAPYNIANIECDIIQLAPIAIYNYIGYDVAKQLPEGEEYNSEAPPPSLIVLSIGTDTTDLVVTNGYRVWQRNIPLGGNHFTKQLSKELKLTFAKAEHFKRNPKQAEDPKAIFQAMRPVFADMVTEVQRSIGFFQSLDRRAKINGVVVLGNTVKLPGLVQYLAKHLGYEMKEVDSFNKLSGTSVISSPSFKDNVLAFATCYGLCLQGLGKGKLGTNLLPREIITQRIIRAKKPWAIAGVSALVLACALNYIFYYSTWNQVHAETAKDGVTWKDATSVAGQVSTRSTDLLAQDKTRLDNLELLKKIGQEVVGSADRRVLWLEVMLAINQSLPPMMDNLPPGAPTPDAKKLPFNQRKDLKIEYVETQFYPELSNWFSSTVKTKYLELNPELANQPAAPPADASAPPADGSAPPADGTVPPAPPDPTVAGPPADAGAVATDPAYGSPDGGYGSPDGGYGGMAGSAMGPDGQPLDIYGGADVSAITLEGPKGPGWVIEMKGYHYYNDPKDRINSGPEHIKKTLLRHLEHGTVKVPQGPGKPMREFTMKELGIGYAILAFNSPLRQVPIENPNWIPPIDPNNPVGGAFGSPAAPAAAPAAGAAGPAGAAAAAAAAANDPNNKQFYMVPRIDFVVQFVWQEKPLGVRIEDIEKKKAEAEAKAKADAEAAAAGGTAEGTPPAPPGGPPSPPTAPPAVTAPPESTPPESAPESAPLPPAATPAPPAATPVPPATPAPAPAPAP
jgi:type IV pilus assembly protein PilM